MHKIFGVAALFATLMQIPTALCQGDEETNLSPEQQKIYSTFEALDFKNGKIELSNTVADLKKDFVFLNQKDAGQFLTNIWNNPPGFDGIGMIFPASKHPLASDSWAIVVTFEDSGYVSDEEAAEIDYDDLLEEMQESTKENNSERVSLGYEPITLVGWAEEPAYNSASKKLYWAKELAFGKTSSENTLNYNIRILGRKGVLNLNVVGSMGQLEEIRESRSKILNAINFKPGHRYEDFDPSSDHVAEYGLAALIAGGALAKTGILKSIIAAIFAAKKLLIVGVVGILGFLFKLYRKES